MVSTFTPNIGLEIPARGDYVNTWDTPVDANFRAIDNAIAGTSSVTATNAGVALTKTQAQAANIIFTGALTNAINATIPAGQSGVFSVLNGTTGNQVINFGSAAGGAALTLSPGIRYFVISDGTNVFLADQSGTPPGSLLSTLAAAAPAGFLLCFGQAISRASYASLFSVVGTTFGAGDGATTFGLPDLRGCTLAGLDNMGGSARGLLTSFGSSGQQIGAQGGEQTHLLVVPEMPPHVHPLNDPKHNHGLNDPQHLHAYNQANSIGVGSGNGPGYSNQFQTTTSTSPTGITLNAASTGITMDSVGGGGAHNNVQPTVLVNWMVKT